MKTAMQELIEKLDYSIKNSEDDYKINFEWIKFHAEILLEKEKEQIIDANRQGRCNDCPFMYSNEDAEKYYNQTYNQNK